ncbi:MULTISPECIES: hypothetical protein [Nostoc]|uniref:Uncharacterized protein n=1 Tax=Nostoc paludosum FACHB-159 TaxID=2692908 RepID=A0ABR8K0S7_9NOSO|nr:MULTISPECIES: hypothetical protein [Nostoc]MBD2676270.1 hypothetical protein [Nostoc sp. FACHB-857]MBD2732603.1 hypothetical protein [Nostoc paludosum FACHB-159]
MARQKERAFWATFLSQDLRKNRQKALFIEPPSLREASANAQRLVEKNAKDS